MKISNKWGTFGGIVTTSNRSTIFKKKRKSKVRKHKKTKYCGFGNMRLE